MDYPAWASKDILTWQLVITEIRHNLTPYFTDPAMLSEAHELRHQAQTAIAEKALIREKTGSGVPGKGLSI